MSKFNPTLSSIRSKIEKLMLMYKALEEELYRVTQENEDLKRQAGLLTSEALPTPNSIDVEAVQTIAQRLRSEIEALRQEIQPPKIEE
ncbi:MAG: hypothetical protein FJZ75_10350 [Bacteroidetes bacterium]|nr:hypothetical protein [Bacteroidota bacterium]